MTSRVLHRSGAIPPTAVGGEGIYLHLADGTKIIDGSGGAAVACLGHGNQRIADGDRPAGRRNGLRPHRHVQQPAGRGPRAHRAGWRTRRADARLFLLLGLRRHRGGAEAGAPVLRRDRPAPAHALHRPPPELPRQHARRARRRRQHDAARAVRADPGAGVQPGLALLRLSLQARRRDRRSNTSIGSPTNWRRSSSASAPTR